MAFSSPTSSISSSPSSPSSPSSYPITLSFRGHVKLHHIHQHMTFMQIMAVVQKRFATQLIHTYTSFRLSFTAHSTQYQISDEDDWQQYLQWIHSTNAMVNAGIMTLAEWKNTCTIVIDAMEMNGNDAIVNTICTTGSTSDSSPITSPELEGGWTPPTQVPTSTDTNMNNNIDTFPSLDITSSLLLQMSEQEQETSQQALDALLDMTEYASTSSSSSSSSSSSAPVDMTDVMTDSRHILDTFEIIPPTYTSLPGPLVIEQGPSTSTLPLPMSLPLPLTLPPANSNINTEAKHISPSTSTSTSTSTSSSPTSISIPRFALRGRLPRSTPRSDRHRITDVTRYAKLTHSMLQLRTLVDIYAEEHPDEMITPVVMEKRNGKERRRKISHRVKVLDDTKKMIIGLKRQHHELQQKIAAAQQQQQQQQPLPDLALSRATYLSICLSSLINVDMHPFLTSSGIHVYRSHINGILAEFTRHFATYHGYEYELIYEKEKTYDILHEIAMPIEWNGMDTTKEITQQYISILEKARGTELVIPKTEEWWKARYGLVIPFIVYFRHPNGDVLYNIYYRQLQCCMVTNHPYIVNVATVNAEVRIPART